MKNSMFFLGGLSIAVNNMSKMVNFYNEVFETQMEPYSLNDFTLYQGKMGDLNITLTPNALLGIRADKSRYQLSFNVPNLEHVLTIVKGTGGKQMQEISVDGTEKYCGILDPDGNSIELVEHIPQMTF